MDAIEPHVMLLIMISTIMFSACSYTLLRVEGAF